MPARRPAAYVHCDCRQTVGGTANAINDAAERRGWPRPTIYSDIDLVVAGSGHCQALAALTAAVHAGRFDAVMLAGPGALMRAGPQDLMQLLLGCSRLGVRVVVILPCDAGNRILSACPHSPAATLTRSAS
jgi:hypothetical protein